MRTILKRIISFLLTVLASAGLVRLPVSVPVPTPADAPEIVMDGETVYTYNTEYTGITYTVSPEGEAVVRSMYGTPNSNHVVSIPPILGGCPVTSVFIQYTRSFDDYIFTALIPESVRSFTITFGSKAKLHINALYCFSDAMTIDVPDGSVSRFICIAGTQTAENASSLPVETYAPEQYDQGCLFTGTVVDMIAPQVQPDFVVPETLGGKTVTALHTEALAARCDLASVEFPASCDLLDLNGEYLEDHYPLPSLRCVFNAAANRTCYRYLLSCTQLLPDGTEHFVNYCETVLNGNSSILPEDATFLDFKIQNGEVYITGLHGYITQWQIFYFSPKDIVIPASIDGCPVVSVGGFGRYYEMQFGPNVVRLHSVTLPPTVRRIEESAFEDLTELTSVNVEHVETVGRFAFANCPALQELHFGKNLKELAENCIGIDDCTKVYFDPECPLETINRALNVQMDVLVLPNHVKTIRGEAFSFADIQTIIFPESVEHIERRGVQGIHTIVMLSRNAELAAPERIYSYSDKTFDWLGSVDTRDTTIYCYENSTAHAYALQYDVPFVLLDDSALLLDGAAQTQTIRIDNPTDRDAFLQSLSVQGGASLDLHSGDTVTTGATVTLTDPTYGHIERTFTVVCPGDLDADGMRDTNADEALLRQYNARLRTDDSAAFAAADVNGDGLVNTTDVTAMRVRRTE
ncbi:MAG: leucine-rich repeat protein [Clostridia bacterium]|nr:leucine-rich repeat protein [Clostridia bacterium]